MLEEKKAERLLHKPTVPPKKKKKRSVQSSHSTALEKHKQKGICAVFFSPFLYLLQVTIATLNTLTHILLLLLYSPPGFFFFFFNM